MKYLITNGLGQFLLSWSADTGTPPQMTWNWTVDPKLAFTFSKEEAESLLVRTGGRFSVIEQPPAPVALQQIKIPIQPPAAPKRMEYHLFEVLDPSTWGGATSWKPTFDEPQPDIPGSDGIVTEEVKDGGINEALDAGWKLYGPPFSHQGKVLQAMVREKP